MAGSERFHLNASAETVVAPFADGLQISRFTLFIVFDEGRPTRKSRPATRLI